MRWGGRRHQRYTRNSSISNWAFSYLLGIFVYYQLVPASGRWLLVTHLLLASGNWRLAKPIRLTFRKSQKPVTRGQRSVTGKPEARFLVRFFRFS